MKTPLSPLSFFQRKIPNRKLNLGIKSQRRQHGKDVDHQFDRRAFDRFPIEFEIEVTTEDMEMEKYKEKVLLKNISGEGVKFVTRQADKYAIGQQLEISIYLPENDEVKARMRGKATVVRIDPPRSSRIREKNEEMGIAVKFHNRLYFERLVVKIPSEHLDPIRELEYY